MNPIVCTTVREVRSVLDLKRREGHTIACVPTMGALHEGHMELVKAVRESDSFTVLWVFVNPTQFNDPVDYERYPRTLDEDVLLAGSHGVDLVFAPCVDEIYPMGLPAYYDSQSVRIRAGGAALGLEGSKRPGHFDGVVHICSVLLNIIRPDVVAFGEKDYQQLQVVQEMVRDLHFGVRIVPVPIVREESGLACSSRNALLSGKADASRIYAAMSSARASVEEGELNVEALCRQVIADLVAAELRPEYVTIVHAESMKVLESVQSPAQLLVAVFTDNNVRLIDNLRLV